MAPGALPPFDLVGPIRNIETITRGRGIRELTRLARAYGVANWRKRKGLARIRFADGREASVELHWYEAHGVGCRELKIKRLVDR